MSYFARPGVVIRDFTLFMLACGALAAWMKLSSPADSPLADLAPLVWLAGPLVPALAYMIAGRWLGAAGFSPRAHAALRWYGLATAIPLGLGGLALAVSLLAGARLGGPVDAGVAAGFAALVVITLIKNVFEETYWRGVLTTQFARTGIAPLVGHLLTGLIWFFWHLPYWLVLLTPDDIFAASGLPVAAFVIVGLIILPLQAVLYGELRLASGSIWPGFVLHTVSNLFAFSLPLIGFMRIEGGLNLAFTPETHGVLIALAFAATGLWVMRLRQSGAGNRTRVPGAS